MNGRPIPASLRPATAAPAHAYVVKCHGDDILCLRQPTAKARSGHACVPAVRFVRRLSGSLPQRTPPDALKDDMVRLGDDFEREIICEALEGVVEPSCEFT